MTDERRTALLAMIDRFTEEDTRTPETARATLVKEGIYTKEGVLAPEFGGPKSKEQPVE